AGLGTSYQGFDKTSGDTTLKDFDHWAAQDSLDYFDASLSPCGFFSLCYKKNYLPPLLGYGRADAGTDGGVADSTGKDLCHPDGFAFFNALLGTTLNCYEAAQNSATTTTNGLPNIRDLANPGGPNTPDPTLTFAAGVQRAGNGALTTPNLGTGLNTAGSLANPLGSPAVQDNFQNGNRLSSIAFAKVFFTRPDWNAKDITEADLPRPDHVHEYGSLYNPYWQARLTQPDQGMRTMFYTLIGVNPTLSTYAP
ncbi:MAG TPA: hypothetical protein VLX90_13135, partial [Steroidobacteraceae bacterium]|nr:hypothetical protein [Steroidobacteraceae bacterium]